MWMVVHMAKSEEAAHKVESLLSAEGILVRIRPVYRSLSSSENYYEIQVLTSEMREAQEILLERRL